jgi:hypothetical protein
MFPYSRALLISMVAALGAVSVGCSPQNRLQTDEKPALRVLPALPEEDLPPVRACLVHTAGCLALDERPFTTCRLADGRCPQEAEFELAGAAVDETRDSELLPPGANVTAKE